MEACCVCSVETAKYRCPGCRLRYCSLICCKKHKETCAVKEAPGSPKGLVKAVAGDDPLNNKGESDELKHLLQNPHIRKMLSTLDQAESKSQMLQKYMQEPLFVEFADRCLSIVNTEEKENLLRD